MTRLSAIGLGYLRRMIGIRGLARTLLASIFVVGGLSAWKRSKTLADSAAPVVEPMQDALPGSPSADQLVKANAGVQVVAGGLFALGVAPRVMAIVLGASLVPTTFAGHRFWESEDAADRDRQQIQFLKNAAVVGGLIFAALDTGGRPSVFWRGRQMVGSIGESISSTATSVTER
jgi:putative oxidoreductase